MIPMAIRSLPSDTSDLDHVHVHDAACVEM